MTDRELMQQALDLLEYPGPSWPEARHDVAKALRARLAQPEHEPVAWGIANTRPTEKNPLMMVMLDEPEPSHLVVPLYTAPPQRAWQGLTDEEIEALRHIIDWTAHWSYGNFARAIEAKLKEKNT